MWVIYLHLSRYWAISLMSICWGIDLDTFFLLHFLHVFQILFPRHSIQRMPLNIAQRETLPSSFLLFVWLEHFGMATFHCMNISRFVTHVSISVSGVSLKSSFMKISPILTHLEREYRQETTISQQNNPNIIPHMLLLMPHFKYLGWNCVFTLYTFESRKYTYLLVKALL